MGLFQHRPEEDQTDWAGLPSEPRDTDRTDVLDAAPPVDPLTIGLGAAVSSLTLPATPPPVAGDPADGGIDDDAGSGADASRTDASGADDADA